MASPPLPRPLASPPRRPSPDPPPPTSPPTTAALQPPKTFRSVSPKPQPQTKPCRDRDPWPLFDAAIVAFPAAAPQIHRGDAGRGLSTRLRCRAADQSNLLKACAFRFYCSSNHQRPPLTPEIQCFKLGRKTSWRDGRRYGGSMGAAAESMRQQRQVAQKPVPLLAGRPHMKISW
ncbi:hypothetical protein PVAP13_9KG278113 [Panicum virgatum]|uniref:Uncharacterized protein n=1 Tax=Panicum virgatum TaxID=38727 RepID=A0A8T0NJ12_PANVG|nr:hypothetical protein PVAP13_9KG278113 [Panicum virgatum]